MEGEALTFSWPALAAIAAAIPGAAVFMVQAFRAYNRSYDWVKRQQEQDRKIQAINDELKVLSRAMLACLRGLHEQGCNGPVTEGIRDLEAHINDRAHE